MPTAHLHEDWDIKGALWKHAKGKQKVGIQHATNFFLFLKGQKTGTVRVELVNKTHQNGDFTNLQIAPGEEELSVALFLLALHFC